MSGTEAINSFFGRQPTESATLPSVDPSPSLTVVPVNEPTPAAERLKRGSRVRHATLGNGRVLNLEGSGEEMRIIVYFESKGRKKLLAKFAQLEVL